MPPSTGDLSDVARDAMEPGPTGDYPHWPRCGVCGLPRLVRDHYLTRGGERFLVAPGRPPLPGPWCRYDHVCDENRSHGGE